MADEIKNEKVEKAEKVVKVEKEKKVKSIILKNTEGKDVPEGDYFYSDKGNGTAHPDFNNMFGIPVDREDMIEIFNKTFKPSDNFLFYRQKDKEVYIIIIPLKYATAVSRENDSVEGDFQKHAISFIGEGSVNLDTLKAKLKQIVKFCNFSDR